MGDEGKVFYGLKLRNSGKKDACVWRILLGTGSRFAQMEHQEFLFFSYFYSQNRKHHMEANTLKQFDLSGQVALISGGNRGLERLHQQRGLPAGTDEPHQGDPDHGRGHGGADGGCQRRGWHGTLPDGLHVHADVERRRAFGSGLEPGSVREQQFEPGGVA